MTGTISTEGDRAIQSDIARFTHNLDGSGVTIGVISDSFRFNREEFRQNIVEGDLPGDRNPNGYTTPVQILKDQFSGSDEGRALAQIIHDIAPGAELLFYGPDSVTDFANGIDALTAAGADIIVDDIFFPFAQPFFQDGPVSQAISRAADQGVTYVSAAGNAGRASYESEFRPSGTTFSVGDITYEAHDFDPGAETDLYQTIILPRGGELVLSFSWSEPFRSFDLGQGAETDLDLFLLPILPETEGEDDETTLLLEFLSSLLTRISSVDNIGADPLEAVFVSNPFDTALPYVLLIGRRVEDDEEEDEERRGTPQPELIKWIDFGTSGSIYEYVNDQPGLESNGTIVGHPNSEDAIAVAAINVNQTPAFGNNNISPRFFTSLGGIPILLDEEGDRLDSPIVRPKPELAAPDRVSTTVTGFEQFSGTSAAAPHVAAVAALVLQRSGGPGQLSPAELRDILLRSTLDAGPPGQDLVTGRGLIQADRAILNAGITHTIASNNQRLQGSRSPDNLIGSQRNDRLNGRQGNDVLLGRGGNDELLGRQGQDWLQGMSGRDRLFGNQGQDTLNGDRGRDQLFGNQGDDNLLGDRGNDMLIGGNGADILIGGNGVDQLTGNGGRDRFGLRENSGLDIITDFQDGVDQLILLDNLRFRQLSFTPGTNGTVIQVEGRAIAQIEGIEPNQITREDISDISLPFF
ncbi:MAG: S8 family serine peptidase [Cyanothece sp. SIO2G6]|nr:S8 family serine peptidase [Cyanothece sp. SIO2G6]